MYDMSALPAVGAASSCSQTFRRVSYCDVNERMLRQISFRLIELTSNESLFLPQVMKFSSSVRVDSFLP